MKVCVFCASSHKVPPIFFEHAQKVANELVDANATIVYGAGAVGLMGCLADTAISRGGKVVGILPHFMHERKWSHNGISELVLVEDMGKRKHLMISQADAIVALPGGCGTLEELMEAFTLKQLGLYKNPIILLNTNGFYNHLVEQIDSMVTNHFMDANHKELWTVVSDPRDVVPAIKSQVQ